MYDVCDSCSNECHKKQVSANKHVVSKCQSSLCVFLVWSVFLCRKLQIERQAVRQVFLCGYCRLQWLCFACSVLPERGTTGEKERQLMIYEESQCLKMSVCVCIASDLGFWLGLRTREIIRCSTVTDYSDLCTTACFVFDFFIFIRRLRVYSLTLCSDFLTGREH